jgi:hypothetical protein
VHVIVEGESPSLAAIVEREVQVAVFKRITVRPEQMSGFPCIRGLGIPVATVVGMVSEGMAETEILKAPTPAVPGPGEPGSEEASSTVQVVQ